MKKDLNALALWTILYGSLVLGHVFELGFLTNLAVGALWVSIIVSIAFVTLVLVLIYSSDKIFDDVFEKIEKNPYDFIESKASTYGTIITAVIASFILAYFGYVALLVFYLILVIEVSIFASIVKEMAEHIIKIKSN